MVRVIAAYTTNSNSPESDSQRYISHTVEVDVDGDKGKIELMAECPIDAMDRVRKMTVEQVRYRMVAQGL